MGFLKYIYSTVENELTCNSDDEMSPRKDLRMASETEGTIL